MSRTKLPRRFEVWFKTKHNANTPEARAAISTALELHLAPFGDHPKRRWHGRSTYGKKQRRGERHHSELCVRFSKIARNLEPDATQAALTAIRTVFPDASVDVRVTVREVMKKYGYDRHEARFMASISNGDSDGDCIVIDDMTGKVIREHVIVFGP